MNPAQLNLGLFAPLSPLVLVVGAFTIWLWGRHAAGTSGQPVAVLAATFSALVALGVFAWQQSVDVSQTLAGPGWLIVPGRVPTTIDFSFHVDGLSLFWLALVAGLGALTIALDGVTADRGQLEWQLLALASAQFVLLTDNLAVLFGFWEISQIAIWRTAVLRRTTRGAEVNRLPLMALAGDLPLLIAVVVCWQNLGSFHLSLLTDPETLAALGPNQSAAIVLLGYCVLGTAYARCLQFPFCTPVLHAAENTPDSVKSILGTVIVPTGLYLLLRCQSWISADPGPQTLLVGAGLLSALLWAGMSITQPTLTRSVVSFCAGSLGLAFVSVGCGGAASLLLPGSLMAGSWAILQLAGSERSLRQRRFPLRAAAVIAIAMCCGVFGQQTLLNTAWSALNLAGESARSAATNPGGSTDVTPEGTLIGPVVPAVIMLAHLLLSLALFRGLFRRRTREDETDSHNAASEVSDSTTLPEEILQPQSSFAIVVVTIVGLAAAPLLAVMALLGGHSLPLSTPGAMGILMILALLFAWILYAAPSDWPARIESAAGGVATLSRRSFYVDELIQLTWVLPWRLLAWLATKVDRVFAGRMSQRLRDLQAGTRQSLLASLADGPLAAYVITLIMGAAVMIVLLIQG